MTGAMATLAFWIGPDFEKPWDTNKDNVYEVTLVVTDSVGATAEYDVTVKVINSTDDNKPGKVTILNRVPEVTIPIDGYPRRPRRRRQGAEVAVVQVSGASAAYPATKCPGNMPVPVGVEELATGESRHRFFIDGPPNPQNLASPSPPPLLTHGK